MTFPQSYPIYIRTDQNRDLIVVGWQDAEGPAGIPRPLCVDPLTQSLPILVFGPFHLLGIDHSIELTTPGPHQRPHLTCRDVSEFPNRQQWMCAEGCPTTNAN